jgi:hypothetical protein
MRGFFSCVPSFWGLLTAHAWQKQNKQTSKQGLHTNAHTHTTQKNEAREGDKGGHYGYP